MFFTCCLENEKKIIGVTNYNDKKYRRNKQNNKKRKIHTFLFIFFKSKNKWSVNQEKKKSVRTRHTPLFIDTMSWNN